MCLLSKHRAEFSSVRVRVCEPYQGRQRRQVHGDGDHAAGEAQLVETGFPLSEEHAEVEPTACQDQAHHHHMGQHHFLQRAHTHAQKHTQTRAGVQRQEMRCDEKNKSCAEANLIIAVVEVDKDVQDLQLSSDGVDHLQRHVRLQNPIIQPAQVAAKTNKQALT